MQQQVELAVSTVIFALRPHGDSAADALWLPLVRRIRSPHLDKWALPGGPLQPAEDLVASAEHTLERTAGLRPRYLEQLYAFGAVDRSPDRVVTIAYWALVRPDEDARLTDGDNVAWFPADNLPQLAFDHNEIIDYALERIRTKIFWSPLAHAFLGDEFTIAQLRHVYESVSGDALDPANFRRQVLAAGNIEPTGSYLQGTSHRPPALYRFVQRSNSH